MRPLLAELAYAHLISEHAPGRYTFHDLLGAYARTLTRTMDSDEERASATHRVLDHYLHTAFAADRLLNLSRIPPSLSPARAGVDPERLTSTDQALAWFRTEHRALLAAIDRATVLGDDVHTLKIAWTLTTFLNRQGHWRDLLIVQRAAVAAARHLGDLAGEAFAHRYLGRAYRRLDQPDEAHRHYGRAVDLHRRTHDGIAVVLTLLEHALVWEQQGNPGEALRRVRHALELARVADFPGGEAWAHIYLGLLHAQLRDHEQALESCSQALQHSEVVENVPALALMWDVVGYAHHKLGHYTEATTCYERALRLNRQLGDRYEEGNTLIHLGDVLHAGGDLCAARDCWEQAWSIFHGLQRREADSIQNRLRRLDFA